MSPAVFTISDVAERFKVCRETVESWIHSGELAALNAAPSGSKRSQYRITEESVAEFATNRGAKPRAIPRPVEKFIRYV